MRTIRIVVLLAVVVPMFALAGQPRMAEASMINDVKDKITRWVSQDDAVKRCNDVYAGARYTWADPVVPTTVRLTSLSVASDMCDGVAPLLSQDANDAYCKAGGAMLDPIFEARWWKLGRKFVGWACVKL